MTSHEAKVWSEEKEQRMLDRDLERERLAAEKEEWAKDRQLELEKHRSNVEFTTECLLSCLRNLECIYASVTSSDDKVIVVAQFATAGA